ncbi:hypothetical protein [Kitasatospora sp. NPDC059327]
MQRHRELVERLLAEHPTQAQAAGQPVPGPVNHPQDRSCTTPLSKPLTP